MAINSQNLRMGPCTLKLGTTDLGGTMDGVTLKVSTKTADLKLDQTGDTVIDQSITGFEMSVETTLAEAADKSLMAKISPYADVVTSGLNKKIVMKNVVGTQLMQYAETLVVHPSHLPETDKSEDFTFPKAIIKSDFTLDYATGKQRGIKVTITALPDFSTTPATYYTYGDPAITAS